MRKKVMFIIGTRPEIVKCASTIRALIQEDKYDVVVVHTGQHKDLADPVYKTFGFIPKYDLKVMTEGQSLDTLLSKMIQRLEMPILVESPDLIMVHGDTHSTLAGALAGYHAKVPIMHLEAGARSPKRYEPFPEEMNRRIVDQIASYHLCQCDSHKKNLKKENINKGVIVGNTSIDAAKLFITKHIDKQKLIIFTIHRRENLGKTVKELIYAINMLAKVFKDYQFVVVTHANPKVAKPLIDGLSKLKNVELYPPLQYVKFVSLMSSAKFIVTDSGGVSQEAPSFKTPVLVLRNVTENKELVNANLIKVIGTDWESVYDNCKRLITDHEHYTSMLGNNPYGDGESYKKVIKEIKKVLK